jgi:hypothetical protein
MQLELSFEASRFFHSCKICGGSYHLNDLRFKSEYHKNGTLKCSYYVCENIQICQARQNSLENLK